MIFLQCFLGCLFAFVAFLVVLWTIVIPYAVRRLKEIPEVVAAYGRGANMMNRAPSDATRRAWEQELDELTATAERTVENAKQIWADAVSAALDTLSMKNYTDAEARERVRVFLIKHMKICGFVYTYDGIPGMKPPHEFEADPRERSTIASIVQRSAKEAGREIAPEEMEAIVERVQRSAREAGVPVPPPPTLEEMNEIIERVKRAGEVRKDSTS